MKMKEYKTPEMEVVEMKMQGSVLLETSGDQPQYNPEPAME